MLRPVRTTVPRIWSEVAIVAVLAFAIAGGCDWFDDPSQVNLSPETTIVSCPSGLVPPGDDVTIVWEGDDPDGQVVGYEWTLDDTLSGTTTEVTMLIAEVEEGTHAFTVAAVDNDGEVDASPAGCTFTASLGDYVDRAVLCELMTTKICPNCWKADLMLERMLEEFGEDDVTVVSYHYDPPPDPLATAETSAACDRYYAFPAFAVLEGDFPTVFFDGLTYDNGAADTTSTKIAYRMQIEARLTVGSPVSIDLTGEIGRGRGSVTATVRVHRQLPDDTLTVRMMITENHIWDGAHFANFVVRDIFDDEPLTEKAVGESLVVSREFVLGDWDPQQLNVIAFVQDDSSAEIIQSARLSTR